MISHIYSKALVVTFLIIAALSSGAISVKAQNIEWKRVQGSAVDIAVSTNGNVAAVDKSGKVYRYDFNDDRWAPIGKNMSRIAATANNFWGVDGRGNLRKFTGTQWQAVGSGAQDVATSNTGKVYVTTNTNGLAVYDPAINRWGAVEGIGINVAIDDKGLIWRIGEDGSISRKLDDAWIGVKGVAKDIAIDKTRVLIVAENGNLKEWNEKTASWDAINGIDAVAAVSAGNNQVWVVKTNGQIFAQGLDSRQRGDDEIEIGKPGDGGSTNAAEVVDNSPLIFELVPDNTRLEDLSIGKDGSIFALTSSGDIKRWSNNEQRFNNFPGTLERIVIQDSGLPIGIGANDNLLEHDGEAWRQVNLSERLIDLTLFTDEEVLAINTSEKAIKLNQNLTGFSLLGGPRAIQIAAQEDGSFWLIDNVNRLYKCSSTAQCERQSKNASDLAIGPAGSVFIIDTNASLYRYNASTKEFDIIRQGDTSRVALGPQDRPWILDNQGRALQAGFFERDENGDRTLTIKTEATENVTTEQPNVAGNNTGIQIVQSISFTSVDVPTSAPGFPNLDGGLRDLTVGENDIVLVTGFADPCVKGNGANWVYNPNSRSFSHLDYLQGANLYVALAVDDILKGDVTGNAPPSSPVPSIPSFIGEWNKDCADQSILLTYLSSVFNDSSAKSSQNFDGATFSSDQPDGVIPDIDFAADGTVINLFGTELEFFQPENANDVEFFDQIQFLRAGVGADGKDIWAVSTTNNVYEFVESTDSFELRSQNPDDKAQDVGVGHDGTVFIVNMSGVLKKWDETSKRFNRTNKVGVTRVAVDSKGNPIVANFPDSQTVFFGR